MTFENDVNANRSGSHLRGAVREAVGIFASRDALQKVVDELTLAGFQRHELSVLANDETIRDHLGHVPQRAEDLAHDPDAPRQSYVSPEDVGSVKGVAVGFPAPSLLHNPGAPRPRRTLFARFSLEKKTDTGSRFRCPPQCAVLSCVPRAR
ncbi:general stress protein [Azospirillum brasilense]|uniref:general stress protein n=1 Tax=Azospirillum brasilense TaxID=192 RepID=UPI001FFF6A6B|nr:general stress protein [Azospirillum brasilense]